MIETEIRRRLRDEFDFTLPRFDFLAQLDRAQGGFVLGELSRRLMVSPGNVTALTERLIADGYITRGPSAQDRRIQIVRLTEEGRRKFRLMAKRHGDWVASFFGKLGRDDIEGLMGRLADLKSSLRTSTHDGRRR